MTPQDLPEDFLFMVESDVVDLITVGQMNKFASLHEQHILDHYHSNDNSSDDTVHDDDETDCTGSIYPNDASTEKLVKLLVTHVTQIQALRNADSIEILVIGCEDVFLILELYVRLCWHLQYSVKCVHITVIEKSSFVIEAWNQLLLSVQLWFPDLHLHVQFELTNFMVFDNTLMSHYDVAVTFIVGSLTPAFALKFTLLSLQHNTRPYYRCSKLFLASLNLFAIARRVAKNASLTFTPQVQMTYRCRVRDTDVKDLCHLTRVGELVHGVVEYIHQFSYHRTSHEDPTARFTTSAIHVSFQKEVYTEIKDVSETVFKNLFTKNLFADVALNGNNERVLRTNVMKKRLLMILRHCTVSIDVHCIDGLENVPVFNDELASSGNKYFETQCNYVDKTRGKDYISLYIKINVSNALRCLQSMQCAVFQYMRLILKAVDVDFNADSFKIIDIHKMVSLQLKTHLTKTAPKSVNIVHILKEASADISVSALESSVWNFLWTDVSNKHIFSVTTPTAPANPHPDTTALPRELPAVVRGVVCLQQPVTFDSEDIINVDSDLKFSESQLLSQFE
jgi:hypothetical protein